MVYLYPGGQRNGLQAARPGISFAPWKKYFHILWVVFRLRLFQLIKQSCEKKIDLGDFNVQIKSNKFQFVLSATPAISARAKSSRIFSLFTDFK